MIKSYDLTTKNVEGVFEKVVQVRNNVVHMDLHMVSNVFQKELACLTIKTMYTMVDLDFREVEEMVIQDIWENVVVDDSLIDMAVFVKIQEVINYKDVLENAKIGEQQLCKTLIKDCEEVFVDENDVIVRVLQVELMVPFNKIDTEKI